MTIEHSITIGAPRSRIWQIMSDVERWHDWTNSVNSVDLLDGPTLQIGQRARVRQPGFPPAVWTVTELDPDRGFTWRNNALGVASVARHEMTEVRDGTTRVTLSVTWTGPLARLVAFVFGKRSKRYVEMEAQGLKARSESAAYDGSES